MLEGRGLSFRFGPGAPALDGVDIVVAPGEIVGLAGASGAGKSTLARILCGHLRAGAGSITIDGEPVPTGGLHPIQLLAQSPVFAVNPRWTIAQILAEAWTPDEATRRALRIAPEWDERYPHELSGGELQRVAIARALASGVRYLVADEITAMLDPITQADIWDVLIGRVRTGGIGMVAISHDAALLARVADRIKHMGIIGA